MGSMMPPRTQLGLARFLEALGYDRLWFADHMLFPEIASPAPDPWTIIAAIAANTSRIQLGSAVSDPHRLHPAIFAQRVATIDRLSQGRILFGLGTGEAMNLEPFGIPWDKKVGRFKEAVTVMRRLLDSDEPFTFEGKYFNLRNAFLSVRPHQRRHIPFYFAAVGPLMQQFCGEVADGWLPPCIPAEHYDSYFKPTAEAAQAAGRSLQSFDRVAFVPVCLTDKSLTTAEVGEIARPFALLVVWPPVVERLGWEWNPPAHLTDTHYVTIDPTDEASVARYNEYQDWIPAEVIGSFIHFGSVHRIRQAIGRYLDAGATSINLVNISPDPLSSTLTLATEVLPYFTRRGAPVVAHAASMALPLARKFNLVPRLTDPTQKYRERRFKIESGVK
jgi:alkanesulfonate monooxygenase SsuD/methylene tetrahydromethanopterin reductase-like flavin-dependent oxidoreductase (luciferase family)